MSPFIVMRPKDRRGNIGENMRTNESLQIRKPSLTVATGAQRHLARHLRMDVAQPFRVARQAPSCYLEQSSRVMNARP